MVTVVAAAVVEGAIVIGAVLEVAVAEGPVGLVAVGPGLLVVVTAWSPVLPQAVVAALRRSMRTADQRWRCPPMTRWYGASVPISPAFSYEVTLPTTSEEESQHVQRTNAGASRTLMSVLRVGDGVPGSGFLAMTLFGPNCSGAVARCMGDRPGSGPAPTRERPT